jgi:acetoin utilization deacetylase AcuC-like enzyme
MEIYYNDDFLKHPGNNLEGSYRLQKFSSDRGVKRIDKNGEKYIPLVHTPEYIQEVRLASSLNKTFAEVKLSKESYKAACLAVGLAIHASNHGGFAVVRPPGHHAHKDTASGFCLFNNLAIAVQKLLNEGKKVAILDTDGHHGDGTESIFKGNKGVFYCSIHQSNAFPGTGYLSGENVLNIPLDSPISEKEYLSAIKKSITKIKSLGFEILAVSAGFDTFNEDKLLSFNLNTNTYRQIGLELQLNFKRVFAVLEGGYHSKIVLKAL